MQQVSDTFTATYEVKRSTFTSYILPWLQFTETLQRLKAEHPKANHIVWAYRHLNDYGQIVENSSDDGEPKGCAGNPTLAQLRGAELINTALLTVRYFGGIKLGTGGMVKAYSEAAKRVIDSANTEPFVQKSAHTLHVPYPLIKRYKHFFKTHGIMEQKREFTPEGVTWYLELSEPERAALSAFETSLL